MAEADHRLALDNAELFQLAVVVVVAPGDARPGPGHENLAEMLGLEQFEQPAAVVGVQLDRVGEPVFGQEGQVGGVQAVHQLVGHVRHHQRGPDAVQLPYPFGQVAQGDAEGARHGVAPPPRVVFAIEVAQERGHHIVDVHQFQLPLGVGDGDVQVAGDIVAEGGNHGVVVRP